MKRWFYECPHTVGCKLLANLVSWAGRPFQCCSQRHRCLSTSAIHTREAAYQHSTYSDLTQSINHQKYVIYLLGKINFLVVSIDSLYLQYWYKYSGPSKPGCWVKKGAAAGENPSFCISLITLVPSQHTSQPKAVDGSFFCTRS